MTSALYLSPLLMNPFQLDRRDFHKLTAAALGGLARGAMLGLQ